MTTISQWHVAANTSQPPIRIQFGVSLRAFTESAESPDLVTIEVDIFILVYM